MYSAVHQVTVAKFVFFLKVTDSGWFEWKKVGITCVYLMITTAWDGVVQ